MLFCATCMKTVLVHVNEFKWQRSCLETFLAVNVKMLLLNHICFWLLRIFDYDFLSYCPSPKHALALVSIIQTYRPWTPRRTSGRVINKKIWRESEAYRNFCKWFDWSLAIKHHIVMAAPIVETIWLVNGCKCHIAMAAPFPVTARSSVQN